MDDLDTLLGVRHFDSLVIQNLLSLRLGLGAMLKSRSNRNLIILDPQDRYIESIWEAIPLQHFTSLIGS